MAGDTVRVESERALRLVVVVVSAILSGAACRSRLHCPNIKVYLRTTKYMWPETTLAYECVSGIGRR